MSRDHDALIHEWLGTDLDAWTRHVLRIHFDPETGSPYWLREAKRLPFDPRDITRYAEIAEFGPFPLATLRDQDPADLVPLSVPRPLVGRVWDSGGTTGSPCRVYYTPRMILHRGVWRRWSFVTEGFRPGRSWIQATPTGPHLIGNGTWEVSELFSSLVYAIDMDPRWVKRLVREGDLRAVGAYTDHLLDQLAVLLETQAIDYVNTTPALFQALVRRRPDLVAELSGARLSGTQISPEQHAEFVTAMDGGLCGLCGLSYGNTFGNAAGLPPENHGTLLPYAPNYPQVTMTAVDPEDWTRPVGYGDVGQVRLTALHEDLFLPNVLERDQAVRHDLSGRWPSDGVANVQPLQALGAVPEGLY